MNVAVLRGRLSGAPRVHLLPSGDELLAVDVTIRPDEGRSESVPVIWFTPPASARDWPAGQEVVVVGRIRRRWFRAGGARASRTEVVATTVVPAGRKANVARAVARALADVEPLITPT